MANTVEAAKTGRARCRSCNQGIEKGDLRFGEEVLNAFSDSGGTTFHWHHVKCAAKKKPFELKEALAAFTGDLPDREELDKVIAENEAKQKPSKFPYAERAASGRSHCGECRKTIDKGALRVAVAREREEEAPSMMMPATPRYYHAEHARSAIPGGADDILAEIRKNSRGLTAADLDDLAKALRDSAPAGDAAEPAPGEAATTATTATAASDDGEVVPF